MTKQRRVVITGIGILSPVGLTLDENWENITNGRSGIGHITQFDTTDFSCKIAGEVEGFNPDNYMAAKDAKRMDRFIQLGYAASMDAFKDSGLEVTEQNAERIGIYVGSGIGGITTIEDTTTLLNERGPRRVSPFFVPGAIINMIKYNF